MPSSMRRGSLGGRPVLAVLRGISGEISSHSSSASPCRIISANLRVAMEDIGTFRCFKTGPSCVPVSHPNEQELRPLQSSPKSES
jgi:hypothetical protein